MQTSYLRGVLFCLVATVSWGCMFPVMTSALTQMDPFNFTAIRYRPLSPSSRAQEQSRRSIYSTHGLQRRVTGGPDRWRASARDKPIKSVALMLDGHVVDTFEGRWRPHVQFDRAQWG